MNEIEEERWVKWKEGKVMNEMEWEVINEMEGEVMNEMEWEVVNKVEGK